MENLSILIDKEEVDFAMVSTLRGGTIRHRIEGNASMLDMVEITAGALANVLSNCKRALEQDGQGDKYPMLVEIAKGIFGEMFEGEMTVD